MRIRFSNDNSGMWQQDIYGREIQAMGDCEVVGIIPRAEKMHITANVDVLNHLVTPSAGT